MSKKKSYMDRKNILSEGFWDKLAGLLRIPKVIKTKMKKDIQALSKIKSLNKTQSELEKILSKYVGKKVELNKYSLKDFT